MLEDSARGCRKPDECTRDSQCSEKLACIEDPVIGAKKCLNPCSFSFCTDKAICSVVKHKAFCSCPPQHRGDPTDAQIGCYKVDCENNLHCADNSKCDLETLRCVGKLNQL